MRKIDLTGKRFGKWVVEGQAFIKNNAVFWNCKCDCGGAKTVNGKVLRNGKSKSCGCYREDIKKTHGMYQTPIHRVWSNMIQRCHNPKNTAYHNYGARGIKVCDRWRNSFEAFYQDVGDVPFEGAQLDRVNNDLDYSPSNFKWVTREENLNNTRINRTITHDGETLTLMQWHRKTGIPYSTLRQRLNSGWETSKILGKES
jgi:hypothetical protein